MLKSIPAIFAAVLLSLSAHAAEGDIFTMPYDIRDLDNGLRVIVLKTDYPDVVTLQIPVQTGSRNEVEEGKSGFAHFFEHMMFRGTDNYSADQYKEILKNAGADQNAYTTDDYTNYHINFTRDDLETIIMLEADRFKNLSYGEDVFRTEALAVKGEYLKNYNNPVQKILERARDLAFDTHTYQHTTMGFLEDIEAMPDQYEYAKVFFDRWYRPEYTTVIVAGDIDPETTFNLVEKYWGDWQPGDYTVEIPAEPAPTGAQYEHIQWEAPTQPWIFLAYRGPGMEPTKEDYPALDVAGELYFGETSDVYRKIVNTDRTADQFFHYFPPRKDPGLFYIGARLTDGANARQVLTDIMDAIVRMRTELVDSRQLEDTKSNARYGFAGAMDNSVAIGATLARFVHFERTPETINKLYRTYDQLTPDDLRQAASRYLVDDARVVISLSNEAAMPAATSAIRDVDDEVAKAEPPGQVEIEVIELPGNPDLVDVSFLFHIGSVLDPRDKKGLAALTTSMLSDAGSSSKTIDEINKAFFPMATGFSSQVDKEMIRLSGSVHRDNLDGWYEIVKEMLLEPGWRQDDFERLKTQLYNGVKTDLKGNNDEELGKEVLYEKLYGPQHPYGALSHGHESDIQGLTLDDVKRFHADHFTRANLTLGLAGGYDDAFKNRVLQDLARLPEGRASIGDVPAAPRLEGRNATIVRKETPAVAVSFGFPIQLRRGDPDWVALWLVRSWLGEHRSSNSHLYQRIRSERGMNYGDYAYIEYFPRGMFRTSPGANLGRQHQVFQVWLRPLRNNNDAHFATRVAMYELQKLVDEGMSGEAFEATRNFLDKYVSQLTASQSRQLGYAIDSDYYGIERFADYVRAGLTALTLEDVNRAIGSHLQTENIHYVFIAKDAADLKTRLETDQPSPMEYNSPKPEELVKEDEIIQDLKLELDAVQVVPLEEVFQ